MMYDLPQKTKAYVLAGVTLGMLFNTMNFTLITPAIPDMLQRDKIVVRRIEATPLSVIH